MKAHNALKRTNLRLAEPPKHTIYVYAIPASQITCQKLCHTSAWATPTTPGYRLCGPPGRKWIFATTWRRVSIVCSSLSDHVLTWNSQKYASIYKKRVGYTISCGTTDTTGRLSHVCSGNTQSRLDVSDAEITCKYRLHQ